MISSHRRVACWVVSLVAILIAGPGLCREAETNAGARQPWTTSKVTGTPEPPPPLKVVRVFEQLKFDHPLLIVRGPEHKRIFVGEQAGVLYSFVDQPSAKAELFCDLRKEIKTLGQLRGAQGIEAVYGLAFHPDFAKNRQCFVCYTLRGSGGGNFADGSRVSRFTVTKDNPPRLDAASEEVVISFPQGGHNGGDIHFGPDGMLYISTGDAASPNPPDPLQTGQDISDLLASILRIDVDRKDPGKNYAIPKDNPFVALPEARGEVWAYGFRNPWRMSFDRQSGALYVGDVGWELWEMVHRVEKGGNYGWSAMEGPQPIKPQKVGPTPIRPALVELSHALACSITGGLVYHGQKFPELRGAYVFGDWETRRLWAARFDGDRVRQMPEIARPSVRFVAFAESHDDELYFLDQEAGTVHALERNDAGLENTKFPKTLAQTGLFASTPQHEPAPGVMRFAVASPQWLDGATAERFVALPGTSSAKLFASGKPIPGLVNWHNFRVHFPPDAVLVRTLSLAGKRLETQMLHYDGIDWRAYTYAWRDDQSDADLVPAEGAEKELQVEGRTRVWQFLSRSQCMSCHSNQSEYALSFLPEQLNRPGPDGRNQLVSLSELGYLQRVDDGGRPLPPFDEASAAREQKMADPADTAQPLEARARAYLHANCGHCHAEHGGGSVPLRLQIGTPTARLNAVDARPTRGDFGLADARIITPGDPLASTLYFRMAKFGRDRMPHIGAELPDEAGLALVAEWIRSLKPSAAPPAVDDVTRQALSQARKLGRGEAEAAEREALLAMAAKLPAGPVRDLFEGYLPADSAGRKLGSSPRPRAILSLAGEAERGELLFWSEAVNCGKCHRVGERGTSVGPDLTAIGGQRSSEDLLDSLLAPSRRVEPKYATFVIETKDGQVVTGLLAQRDETTVVVRDNQGKEVKLAAANVETVRPSVVSLMPEAQLAGLTAQEAADLLAYLVSRRAAK